MTVDQQIAAEAPAAYLERYGLMLLIRLFETEMQRLFLKGEVHGTTHLSAGQEAVQHLVFTRQPLPPKTQQVAPSE